MIKLKIVPETLTHLLLCTKYYVKNWVLKDEQGIVLMNKRLNKKCVGFQCKAESAGTKEQRHRNGKQYDVQGE